MSEAQHKALLKTPKQLIAAVIAGFLVPIAVIALILEYVDNINRTGAGTDAMSSQAVAARVAPLAQVKVDAASAPQLDQTDTASATQAAAAASDAMAALANLPAATPAPAASMQKADAAQVGKALYQQVCQACHAAGVAGAPRFGNAADWAPRLKDSIDTIYHYALTGKGAMPPKGGSNASDADVKAAVNYMLSAAKQNGG